MYRAWTDGAYRNSTGQGGWAAVINPDPRYWLPVSDDFVVGGVLLPPTTNQRAELHAVIGAMRQVPVESPITIVSDSQYVIYTLTRHWHRRANLDLWLQADRLIRGRGGSTTFEWVPRNSTVQLVKADEVAKVYSRERLDKEGVKLLY